MSKATAVPLAKAAARIMLGATIAELRAEGCCRATATAATLPADAPVAVKEAVLPFKRFRTPRAGVDSLLGPEMKSTGEVMGIDTAFGTRSRSRRPPPTALPTAGRIFVTVANRDKRGMIFPVKRLADLGFEIVATAGTAEVLRRYGVGGEIVGKLRRGGPSDGGPSIIGRIRPVTSRWSSTRRRAEAAPRADGYEIRSAAVAADIPCITTVPGAAAAVMGIEA